ncbi:MAG TPA: 50S ribosomal protein L19 [Candidatus Omnitrophota bacterium]|nr:50S ribosomal protein L19 [Candidatus Omnitrophota bacterium]
MDKIAAIEKKYSDRKTPEFEIGDTVDVHFKVKEENKMRVQLFGGIVIGKKGKGMSKTFTVRRISYGEGVERIFPLYSPRIEKVVVKKRGKVRRAKLYFLRDKTGKKATKVKEKIAQKKD